MPFFDNGHFFENLKTRITAIQIESVHLPLFERKSAQKFSCFSQTLISKTKLKKLSQILL